MRARSQLLLLVLIPIGLGVAWYSHHGLRKRADATSLRQASLPQRMLWVWEHPEDLHTLPAGTGIAILQQTLRLGSTVIAIPRKQPFLIPVNTPRIVVVRIETEASFAAHLHDEQLLNASVAELAAAAQTPQALALQIDFDAKRSERAFYRKLLDELRTRMPAGLPLDITALASWCSNDDWLSDLPINEATPMFFRMEPDRRRLVLHSAEYSIRESTSAFCPWGSRFCKKFSHIPAILTMQRLCSWFCE